MPCFSNEGERYLAYHIELKCFLVVKGKLVLAHISTYIQVQQFTKFKTVKNKCLKNILNLNRNLPSTGTNAATKLDGLG